MEPLRTDPMLVSILSKATHPVMGIVYGIIVTVMIQSSSVVVGLVIVLVSQGTISLEAAIPIVIGANIGTTSTALVVSLKFNSISKLVALSASTFNLIGVIITYPFFGLLCSIAKDFTSDPSMQVAFAFTISNTYVSIFFLIFLKPTLTLLEKHPWYQESKEETEILGI